MDDGAGEVLRLRLYVAGDAPNSMVAVAHLHDVLAAYTNGQTDVEIVDVLIEPERGLRDGVFVTPMLIKVEPPPERRVLGNLSDRLFLLAVLGFTEPPLE